MTTQVESLVSLNGLRIYHCRELWCRLQTHCLDSTLLWPAAETPIRPIAWEPPYAVGVPLKRYTHPKKKKNDDCQMIRVNTHKSSDGQASTHVSRYLLGVYT